MRRLSTRSLWCLGTAAVVPTGERSLQSTPGRPVGWRGSHVVGAAEVETKGIKDESTVFPRMMFE